MIAALAGGAVALSVVAAVVAVVRRRVVLVSVSGQSMAPTLRHGAVVVVRRTPGRVPSRGEVVVVEDTPPCRPGGPAGGAWMIKRVVAVPGDPVPSFLPAWAGTPGGRVPAGQVVLLGDNAGLSRDSRHFGTVRVERVLGVVLRRGGRRSPGAGRVTASPARRR